MTTHRDTILNNDRPSLEIPCSEGATDEQLLRCFLDFKQETAFALLVRRHGPMVLHVSRRVLGKIQDAEDVFQATFLLLARKAGSIKKTEAVASWLHGVAFRLSMRVKKQNEKRLTREQKAATPGTTEPGSDAAWRELQAVLDEELNRLPEKYRAPLLLCYLEGKTQEETAQQLGWPIGTVRGRLARAREMLRKRFERRGFNLAAPAFALTLAVGDSTASVPQLLLDTTIQQALPFAANVDLNFTAIAPQVAELVQVGLNGMLAAKGKLAILLLTLGLIVGGVGVLGQRPQSGKKGAAPETTGQGTPIEATVTPLPRPSGSEIIHSDRIGNPDSSGAPALSSEQRCPSPERQIIFHIRPIENPLRSLGKEKKRMFFFFNSRKLVFAEELGEAEHLSSSAKKVLETLSMRVTWTHCVLVQEGRVLVVHNEEFLFEETPAPVNPEMKPRVRPIEIR